MNNVIIFTDIPIFGVLTHADEIGFSDPNFCKFEKDCLGLSPMRYLRCTNCYSNFPVDNERIPDVEVPVMRFLRQVNLFVKKKNNNNVTLFCLGGYKPNQRQRETQIKEGCIFYVYYQYI